jgi:hypothetical protein
MWYSYTGIAATHVRGGARMTHRRRVVRGLALTFAMLLVLSGAQTRLEEERA